MIVTRLLYPLMTMIKAVKVHYLKKSFLLFGTDKDIISIADNFDAPLEEFED
ncbi:hypothetical protein [Dolichospermum circinale]|uniref:hypothetical protein n=1 Tax=Dolichospermum circinale TaxID=109265 RepID=UPI0018CA1517|nr:hypothetical protein [Dolichospermum circinale]MDB9476001.1 hypothetical protein [Dolichospermum circinale CS-537/11]MDB9482668.1 hypothetical protein [Dolichospermum circinale CS-537/05]